LTTHMADAGTDTYDRDMALSMLSNEQDALYQIEQAIDRIRQGAYGFCELTGAPIEPERLKAIPWTRFSFKASQTLEREGQLKRAAFGERETVSLMDVAEAERETESEE
jgi:DnaK suppressor protein